jgi:superfamily II DNA or RNA helicase
MVRLEDLTPGVMVQGILPGQQVRVIAIEWYATDALDLTYEDATGNRDHELVLRDREPDLELVERGCPWSFDGDAAMLRLVSEAYRIHLAHLFDPLLAVHTSLVEPLPHQITAVYGEMLSRQPLRFLLADDPGAGKTIMAGLLIRELMIRGDLHRCLIVCPGSLSAQWQDELYAKFQLPFEILTTDRLEAARTGNAFAEMPLVIARLDQLSRSEDINAKLAQSDWDLVVCDEAHKMSASLFGGEIRETKRYKLGKLLATVTRHLLLMTATPHNGREEDFQLFMALLDSDRFEGRFRDGTHVYDASDLMRRLIKEDLLKFDGTPLFPERKAYTVAYRLSNLEAQLYQQVTDYVKDEFNRADKLENNGRKGTVGFALTVLQRRLASSPEAIYQSVKRRRERLEKRCQEEKEHKFNQDSQWNPVDWDEFDEDDIPVEEREIAEEEVADQATASKTIAELQREIDRLKELEDLARQVRFSNTDKKWEELSKIILDFRFGILDSDSNLKSKIPNLKSRKLVIFTEHRDTLNYLTDKIRTLLGRSEAVVAIHGGLRREERKKAEEAFKQDPEVQVLLATDAAGEGINLQRSHLMVNYDLPWNPNRLEQRFGRIHRIGQTEVCHLWNLVAAETREGDVYRVLLEKITNEQKSLNGKIFDVLGKAISGKELRELLIEAIRYGDKPDVRSRLTQVVSDRLDQDRVRQLLDEEALARDSMDASKVQQIREDMERAIARRLQPHFVASFFLEAFTHLGGMIRQKEQGRYAITHVPAVLRHQNSTLLRQYERVCFDKEKIHLPGKPLASFICPGHPLLDATIRLILERYREVLKQGAILVDENDPGEEVRSLIYLEHAIQDARTEPSGKRRIISQRMQFVEILDSDAEPQSKIQNPKSKISNAGYAPYLDYRPLSESEKSLIPEILEQLSGQDFETQAKRYAVTQLVPMHLEEVKQQKESLVDRTIAAVKERLTKEIIYWDGRAEQLRLDERAGKPNAKLNSALAQQRADGLQSRLTRRMADLQQERQISPATPVVVGGALVVPIGLLLRLQGKRQSEPALFARETKRVEQLAMQTVIDAERRLGHEPIDVSAQKCGWDIESRIPNSPHLRLIEVKGRIEGAGTVTVTKNEILAGLNRPESFILAIVQVPKSEEFPEGDVFRARSTQGTYKVQRSCTVRYVRQPFQKEPDFGVDSVNYNWQDLWNRGSAPQ